MLFVHSFEALKKQQEQPGGSEATTPVVAVAPVARGIVKIGILGACHYGGIAEPWDILRSYIVNTLVNTKRSSISSLNLYTERVCEIKEKGAVVKSKNTDMK